ESTTVGSDVTTVVPESTLHPSFKTLPEPIFDGPELAEAPETKTEQVSINNDANYVNISSSNHVPQNGTAQEENENEQLKQPAEYYKPESPIKISATEDSPRTAADCTAAETPTPTSTPID